MWQAEILTLFPAMVTGYLEASILGKARTRGLLRVEPRDIREHAEGKHRVTDDAPYGGGAGMVMKPEPLVAAIEAARLVLPGARVLLTSPRGERFSQEMARTLAAGPTDLILVAGRYEGVDERVRAHVDAEVSLGDFVLTGGEPAALAMIDAVVRLLPGALGDHESASGDSHYDGLLSPPSYTRPPVFRDMEVPEVLRSGNHARIEAWRLAEAERLTKERRPDLWAKHEAEHD